MSHYLVVVVSFEDPLATFVLRSVPALKVTFLVSSSPTALQNLFLYESPSLLTLFIRSPFFLKWDPWRIRRIEANSGGGREGGEGSKIWSLSEDLNFFPKTFAF